MMRSKRNGARSRWRYAAKSMLQEQKVLRLLRRSSENVTVGGHDGGASNGCGSDSNGGGSDSNGIVANGGISGGSTNSIPFARRAANGESSPGDARGSPLGSPRGVSSAAAVSPAIASCMSPATSPRASGAATAARVGDAAAARRETASMVDMC